MEEKKDINIKIGLVSPETIHSWSFGKIKKAETINYRTLKPERDGLFCERIFGPMKDWECFCGKYKSMRYKGVVCDRCGVEVTKSDIRREQMGHIDLAAPVAHIWYVKRIPSQIALLLDITSQELEQVLYFDAWLVLDVQDDIPLKKYQVFTDFEYRELRERHGDKFEVDMGAEALKKALSSLNCKKLCTEIQDILINEKSAGKKKRLLKRLSIAKSFVNSGNKPEWMILDALPVIPPDLRPMVQLDGGRFATSDLNDLYRRVINRNNRLERLIELRAPEVIIRNEKRMLQESVDALFDNGRRARPVKGSGNRPLKSLSDVLKGKQGRFRQNLLGKRVDYSGRSVIVVAPELKLHQCGLPKRMAVELFKPFIMHRLVAKGCAHNIKSAKRLVERETNEVWDALEEVIKEHPILLNRAPTLHRAGIQAFEPILVEGEAIKMHPLVCSAFNADFDGDQMAVHVPLSLEAQLEARLLMLSAYNLLSPSNGKPLITPSQDIVLGLCWLTIEKTSKKDEKIKAFKDKDEAICAYEMKQIDIHSFIKVRMDGAIIETTVGRLIFNEAFPKDFGYVNKMVDKSILSDLTSQIYFKYGIRKTVQFLDEIKKIGYIFATKSGSTIAASDLKIPVKKERLLSAAHKRAEKIVGAYEKGVITTEERYNQVVDLWTSVNEDLGKMMIDEMSRDQEGFNPVYLMVISGARGSKQQIRQLAGMRGLMAKPSGEIIELPITSNFREGLSVLEYFISTHGARKGLADTALKTADAGYLTRRLVDVSQDVVISEKDCGTINGTIATAIKEGDEVIESLGDRVLGRVSLDNIVNPMTGEVIVQANDEIDAEATRKIETAEIERIRIRSVLTCESSRGVCSKCYGWNLAIGRLIDIGEAAGIMAAQSIGEPGTQLTMRTFHIGGTAHRKVEEAEIKFDYPISIIQLPKRLIELSDGTCISSREGKIVIGRVLFSHPLSSEAKSVVHEGFWVNVGDAIIQTTDGFIKAETRGTVRILEDRLLIMSGEREIPIKTGAHILVKEGEFVDSQKVIAEFDPYNEPILTEATGTIKFRDIVLERTLREELDENTGLYQRVIIGDRESEFQPKIIIIRKEEVAVSYIIPNGARLVVQEGDEVQAGSVIAKIPQELIRTKDITGGLPRVAELFEARHPKDAAIVSEIDGTVLFKEVEGGKTRIIEVKNEATEDVREYSVSMGRHLRVHSGDKIRAGDRLIEGSIDPHDILKIEGERALQMYLLNEVQEVYRLQGVEINDKHIELIVRQMLKKVRIEDSGDTDLLPGEQVDRFLFKEINEKAKKEGKKLASAKAILLGITKASLSTDSFISSASFQETTRILTEAAIAGRRDELLGLKENVIIGRLIPAGTGHKAHRLSGKIKVVGQEENLELETIQNLTEENLAA
ncbi:MAG: DNA-directed RNA polymerase subunit beta' [bacterium]|nr:DNA-directed RNA polymerase subunit beta' [bacterium]